MAECAGVACRNAAWLTLTSLRVVRKEPSSNTVAQVWTALLSQTRQESRDHSSLSESCSNVLIQLLTQCLECTQRLAKKVLMSALQGESAPAESSSTQKVSRFIHPRAVCRLRIYSVPLPGFAIIINTFGLFSDQRHLHAATRWAAQGYYGDADCK